MGLRENDSYSTVLADLREKRRLLEVRLDDLTALIHRLEGEVDQAMLEDQWEGKFLGMGMAEAAEQYLKGVGEPRMTREIWNAISSGGVVTASSDPVNCLSASLRPNARFTRHGKRWGLTSWADRLKREEFLPNGTEQQRRREPSVADGTGERQPEAEENA